MGYRVKLNVFEVPFDLLVYLIEHAQMSIYDIKISEITNQYLNYVEVISPTHLRERIQESLDKGLHEYSK